MYIADLIAEMIATKKKIQEIGADMANIPSELNVDYAIKKLPDLYKSMLELRTNADKLLSVKTYIDDRVIYARICGDIYELRNTGAFVLSAIQNTEDFRELFSPRDAVRQYYPVFNGLQNPLFIFDGYELDFSDSRYCRIFFHDAKLDFINGGAVIQL